MTPDQFFAKFALFADTPNAVAKMRELILDLGSQGRLIAQDGAKEVIPLGSILAEASFNGISKGPTDDSTATEILKISAGTSRPDFFVNEDDFKYVELSPSEIENGRLLPGDLLACRYNGNLHFVGKFSYYRGVSKRIQVNPDKLIRFRVDNSRFCARYVCYMINSPTTRTLIERMCATTAGNIGLSAGKLKTVQLSFPPLAEQKRIVAKVDELMALCDQLESQQKQRETKKATLVQAALTRFTDAPTPASLEFLFHKSYAIDPAELRKTILTLAVTGRLVPQDPNDKSANTLLSSSANGGASTLLKTDDEKPFELPGGWVWAKFSQLGELGRGKSKHRPRNDPSLYSNGKYPLVQTGDVARSNGKISTYTGLYNEDGLAQSKMWPKGTLCITIAANIADSGVLEFDACFPDSVVGFVPNNKDLQLQYFEYFMRTAKSQLEKFAPATAQKNINLGILEEVSIPLPPASEQMRIVAKVEELMGLVDKLEAQLAASRDAGAKLMEAVVAAIAAAA